MVKDGLPCTKLCAIPGPTPIENILLCSRMKVNVFSMLEQYMSRRAIQTQCIPTSVRSHIRLPEYQPQTPYHMLLAFYKHIHCFK